MTALSQDVFFAHLAPFFDRVTSYYLDVILPQSSDSTRHVLQVNRCHLLMDDAIKQHSDLMMLKWLKQQGVAIKSSHLELAYEANHRTAIEWLSGLVLTNCRVFMGAVRGGNKKHMEATIDCVTDQCKRYIDPIQQALRHNDLGLLQWLRQKGFRVKAGTLDRAIPLCDVPILEWLRQEGCKPIYRSNTKWTLLDQPDNGKFQWGLQRISIPLNLIRSVCLGQDEERKQLLFRYWSVETQTVMEEISLMASSGDYSTQHLLLMPANQLIELVETSNIIQQDTEKCREIMEHFVFWEERLDVVRRLHANGFPLSAGLLSYSISNDDLDMVEWLLHNHCPRSDILSVSGIRTSMIRLLLDRHVLTMESLQGRKYLFAAMRQSPDNARLIKDRFPEQIEFGHWCKRLTWKEATQADYEWLLHHDGCLPNNTMSNAIASGDLSFIQWAYERGCAIGTNHLREAIGVGVFANVEWILEHSTHRHCKSDAIDNGNRELIQLLHNHGCTELDPLLKPGLQILCLNHNATGESP